MDLFVGRYGSVSHPSLLAGSNGEIDDGIISDSCDGMAVDGLVGNSSYFDAASDALEPFSCQDATNETSTSGIATSRSSELSNSERTLEKWEYLLRTRPRDPMYDIISFYHNKWCGGTVA
jgi:hypothetical protein